MASGIDTEDAIGLRASHDQIVQHMALNCTCSVSWINIRWGCFMHGRQLGPVECPSVVVMTGEVWEMIQPRAVR